MQTSFTILKPFQPFSQILAPLETKLTPEEFYQFQKSMIATLPLSYELCTTAVEHAAEFLAFESSFEKIVSNSIVEIPSSSLVLDLIAQLAPQFRQLERKLGVTITTNNLADECTGAFHIKSNTAILNLPKIEKIVSDYITSHKSDVHSPEFKATIALNILQIVAHECAHAVWYRVEENITSTEMFYLRSSILRLYTGVKAAMVISHTGEDSNELKYVTGDPSAIFKNYQQLTETLMAGEFMAEYFVADLLTTLDYAGLSFSTNIVHMLTSANETRDLLGKKYLTIEAKAVFAQLEETFNWASTTRPDYEARPRFLREVRPPKVPKIAEVMADEALLALLKKGQIQETRAKTRISEMEPYKQLFLWSPKGKKVHGINLSYTGKLVILNLRNYTLKHPDAILHHPNKALLLPLLIGDSTDLDSP